MVVDKVVVWIGNPEAGWSQIVIKKRPTFFSFHDQVALNMIFLFDCIRDEDNVALDIICDVINQSHLMCAKK